MPEEVKELLRYQTLTSIFYAALLDKAMANVPASTSPEISASFCFSLLQREAGKHTAVLGLCLLLQSGWFQAKTLQQRGNTVILQPHPQRSWDGHFQYVPHSSETIGPSSKGHLEQSIPLLKETAKSHLKENPFNLPTGHFCNLDLWTWPWSITAISSAESL